MSQNMNYKRTEANLLYYKRKTAAERLCVFFGISIRFGIETVANIYAVELSSQSVIQVWCENNIWLRKCDTLKPIGATT